MRQNHLCHALMLMLMVTALVLVSCDGKTGDPGPPGPIGPPGPSVATPTALHIEITGTTIGSPPVVDLTVSDQDGNAVSNLTESEFRFTIAKLIPADDMGNPSKWQNYINTTETVDADGPGVPGETAIQASTENNGTLVNHGDGTYTYTFATDVADVTAPLAVSFEPHLTHRIGMELRGGVPGANAVFTFRPADGATTGITTRSIVDISSCNECHGKLAVHGNGRFDTAYCVVCHTPDSVDANSGNRLDFKVMIHKIHRGAELPSVLAGTPYVIYGFGDSANDYSDVAFPQDIRHCTKCHDAADASTPEADNWRTKPSREACGSCHDQVNFDTGENHDSVGPQPDNSACSLCHPATGPGFGRSVEEAHTIPASVAAAAFQFNLISVTDTAPGAVPVVTFSVTDPTQNDAAYDILNDPEFTAGGGASRLAVLLGWPTSDYTNTGSGSDPALPISINALTSAVANGDGTFSVTSPVPLPLTVTGTGVAAIEGHPAADPDGDGTYDVRVPVRNVFQNFAITDPTVVARRDVVDLNKCNQCHFSLSLHGNNRTDAIQVCVICHNPNDTDISFRTSGAEVPIDFKYMIHAIHAAQIRQSPLAIIGFGGSVNDFSTVRFPGNLQNCLTCHLEGTFELPLGAEVLATTVDSDGIASDPPLTDGDPTNDLNITATAATCFACHDRALAMAHMAQNGGAFDVLQSEVDNGTLTEACAICHGPGRIADVREVHQVE